MSGIVDAVGVKLGDEQFLDYRKVEWNRVRRAEYLMRLRYSYEYPGPVRHLYQRLVVVPPDHYGNQNLLDQSLTASAPVHDQEQRFDDFGNRVYQLYLPAIEAQLNFEVCFRVERLHWLVSGPFLPASAAAYYLEPNRLTAPDDRILEAAQSLKAPGGSAEKLAERINDWVYAAMKYSADFTGVKTTAAQALAVGRGLCQDYAHIMLALCRAADLPARYVSGHLLGEGGSHAWVEVLVPTKDDPAERLEAVAFDPTNHCRVGFNYVTIAVGRDYSDVSPTSGTYTAPYLGQLTSAKRAGLVRLEYLDGTTLSAA